MERKTNSRGPRSSGPSKSGGFKRRSSAGPRKSSGGSGGGYRGGSSRGGGRGRSGGGGRGGKKMPTFDPSQFINKTPVQATTEKAYKAKNTFKTFGLSEELSGAIEKMGIEIPSPIQDQAIPEILAGNDVVGLAETGTGKTAAFLVPLIEKTLADRKRLSLILAPTRELAIQIDQELKKLSQRMRIFSTVCVGGTPIYPQIKALRRSNQFIIGTPGRVMDLMDRGVLDTTKVTTVVLDEADRMLDMGFVNDMRKVMAATPADRETLFFSATMNDAAEKLVKEFLKDPVTISVKKKDVTNSIEQDIVEYRGHHKFDTLLELLDQSEFTRVIIFGAMKHSVQKLADELDLQHIKSVAIHGNKTHPQRQRALKTFKDGNARVLVATDVAARGIHVDDVSHVINYDLPNTFDDYVHRIGRTGRGTKFGKALTFVPYGGERNKGARGGRR